MLRPIFFAITLAFGIAAPAIADDDLPDGASIVGDEELAEQRGGFRFSGMDIRLGADIKTFLNGELALHTVMTIGEGAFEEVQTVSSALTLADANALRNNVLANGAITMNVGDQRVYLANDGQTALIHGTDGSLQNVLINTASNIAVSQEVTATLDVGGYQMFADSITAEHLSGAIGEEITRSMTGTFGL